MSEAIQCGKCGTIIEERDIVSIYHKKNPEGHKTLYLCKKCCYTEYSTVSRQNRFQNQGYYAYQDTLGLKWFAAWMENPTLIKAFRSFKEMRSFASTYGYGLSHIRQMVEHKETLTRAGNDV